MARMSVPFLAFLAVASVAAAQASPAPSWEAVEEVEEVEVLTADEDGAARETTIWLTVLDGQGYVRTSGSTTWGGNVERNSDISLRIEGTEYPLHAVFIEDDELRARVVASFREKYGWFDGFVNFIRGSRPRIMRLDPRS